ncbi:MAG: EVE domain-containing protein [Planctomycetes bacterium]|nr:EVE domain-containing protein [Planctomycetota bacterium]
MTNDRPRYWLMKSEPNAFSFDDLLAAKGKRTHWDGIRNYQARNFMRDEMRKGDRVLFYHSNAKPPGVVGLAEVVKEAYPDHTQFDPASGYHDPQSDPSDPRWLMVDIKALCKLPRLVELDELKSRPELAEMAVVQRGQRLSVQPVTPEEWGVVLELGGLTAKI